MEEHSKDAQKGTRVVLKTHLDKTYCKNPHQRCVSSRKVSWHLKKKKKKQVRKEKKQSTY